MRMVKLILAFDINAKLLNFSEKLKTASCKCRTNMFTRSFLPFVVLRKHNSNCSLLSPLAALFLKIADSMFKNHRFNISYIL